MIDPEMKLTEHFKLKEFFCKCGCELPQAVIPHLKETALALEWSRELHRGRPISITSGYRCPKHNAKIGGAKNSFHMRGQAADFVVSGVAPKVTQEILKDWRGGLELAPTWTHLDLGPKRRFKP